MGAILRVGDRAAGDQRHILNPLFFTFMGIHPKFLQNHTLLKNISGETLEFNPFHHRQPVQFYQGWVI
jgi:hypothetical protein